ncbi:hypothetical protein HPB49_020049 [Dermacentor silvarum]|uniref:Uncharacterized protein n=1 Tax=Dermacentor silvarum TaxID=543639 RepID=A0ACB8CHA2_DERSI|nr:hypothetical protein HPB49_020049 [Dermacentor silvarum]
MSRLTPALRIDYCFLGTSMALTPSGVTEQTPPKAGSSSEQVEAYDLQLAIHPQNPTRLGNSVSADTFPDPTFTNNVDDVFWTNLEENLGRDHLILSVSVGSPKIRGACGHAVITDWVNYRKVPMPQILTENAEDWATHIRDAHKATS